MVKGTNETEYMYKEMAIRIRPLPMEMTGEYSQMLEGDTTVIPVNGKIVIMTICEYSQEVIDGLGGEIEICFIPGHSTAEDCRAGIKIILTGD